LVRSDAHHLDGKEHTMLPVLGLQTVTPIRRRNWLSLLRFAMPETAATESGQRNVAEVLAARAKDRPNQPAFVFLTDPGAAGEGREITWTYAELDRRAKAIAAELSKTTKPGDRVVLVFPPGLDFIAAFFGCLYAGVLPVPATHPKPRRGSSRLDSIVADCSPTVALTTGETRRLLKLEDQSPAVGALTWLAVDELNAVGGFTQAVARSANDPAFLQYTSGSTSQPRGVVVTHGNLLHNLELIRQGFGIPEADSGAAPQCGVFWLPAYHDMGLIGGILEPIYVGGTAYLMAPASFLQRPLSWLETISRTGAVLSGAPNCAYDLCVRKTTPEERAALDLSRWQLAFCGAEPIDARTLKEFAAAFEPAGFPESAFYPCYGLAETTLLATGGRRLRGLQVLNADRAQLAANELEEAEAEAADAAPLVSCGRPLGDQEVRIVNPQSFEPCHDGAIGEIWLRSPSVAAGYWNHPEELWQTFGGRLADGSGPYLRTGDLGAFYQGELYVTGRAKDLIIIRGRNLYPQDVERTAQQAHEAVDLGAAFAVKHDGQEQLVVVHQVEREHRRGDLTPVLRAIRAAVVDEHDIDPAAIVLLRPGALPLTSSGKVQRHRCRELFDSNALEELARWMQPTSEPAASTASAVNVSGPHPAAPRPKFLDNVAAYAPEQLALEIQSWMLAWLADRVEEGTGELTPTAPFTEIGVDSLTALELNVEFEKVLGVRLPPAAAWSYPTPAALSRFLADSLLGLPTAAEITDSWFLAMEEDARRP
jgi:acyl-CoA synthetase (AMP-forming)/AMP-acid ligase II/acyl carrier protein